MLLIDAAPRWDKMLGRGRGIRVAKVTRKKKIVVATGGVKIARREPPK
jgi:hypothetical protein